METVKAVNKPDCAFSAIIGAFVLAIVHQYLFYENVLGVSHPIFVLLFYGYMYRFTGGAMRRTSPFSLLLGLCIAMLSMTFVLFNNPLFYRLNFLVVPCLILIHMAYMLSPNRFDWSDVRRMALNALDQLIPQNVRHWATFFGTLRAAAFRKMGSRRESAAGKVLIGLAIALPLLVIVVNLLASADGVFNHFLSGFPEWLDEISLGEGFKRILWIGMFTVLFFGYLWGFVDHKTYDSGDETGQHPSEAKRAGIDPIIIATVLIAVNAVYVLFVAVQFSYLFGAWDGVLPEGRSYAEYATSGFQELVAVTFINFILLIGTLVYGGKGSEAVDKLNAILLYLLIGCSSVMLYSAYMRLALYEEAYGYTYIRFLVHAFMIYLGILLLIAGLRVRNPRIPLAKWYIAVSLLAYAAVNYAGMDRIIADKNIERYRESGDIDEQYLQGLSSDAVMPLIRFGEEYPGMKNVLRNSRSDWFAEDRDWPSFNLSLYRAKKELAAFLDE